MSMHSNRFRHALLGASAMISAAAIAGASYAADTRQYDFDMPAQPLTLALKTFGATADQQLIFSEGLVSGRTAPPLKGAYTSDQALAMLLNGSGLTADKTPSGVVTIRSAADPQSGSAAGGADGTVQALIVTAQKREENIQDVPIAMSAFTQEDLTRSQVAGGPDLMTQVPNFTFTKTNFSSYSIQIRGIGTQAISATTDAAVAVAFNNTSFIRNRFFEQEFYDLQRVEVLRGPQGTLYGRNATAGVVNIISQKPKFAYEARLSADVANYKSARLEGMINLPLVEDKVAVRLAGAWTKRDGYDTNEITGNQIDGRDLWSTRLSMRLEPTDNIHANLIWEHFQEDDDRLRSGKQLCKRNQPDTIAGITVPWGQEGTGSSNGGLYDQTYSQGCEAASLYSPDSFQAPNGLRLPYYRALSGIGLPIVDVNPDGSAFDPYASTTQSRDLRVIESTIDPVYRAKTDTVELQVSFDLSHNLTLTSETGWLSDKLFSSEDYNRFNTRPGAFDTSSGGGQDDLAHGIVDQNGYFCDPQVGCANRLVAVDLSTARSTQFSQELRVASSNDGPFNFSLGANFLRYDTEDKYYVFINTLSLFAAHNVLFGIPDFPNYVPGVSDNHQCLTRGFATPNPDGVLDIGRCVYTDPNPITSLNDLGHNYFLSRNPYKLISYAVFGEAYYAITSNLKLTAGLRWTVDKKEAPRLPSWVLGGGTVGYPVAEVIEQEWREPTGRLTLDWKPDLGFTDQTLIYGSYAHGYKAGGANPPASGLVMYSLTSKPDWELVAQQQAAVAPRTFEPEFVNAFEIGSKNTLLGGALTLNGDAFYYDYTGYQISQIVNRSAINLNFDAKIWGLELESDWRPVENLSFGFKLGYERTSMAKGSKAVDIMDRTAGRTDWFVTAPFPSLPSNCILPTYIVTRPDNTLTVLGAASGGLLGPCEMAYVLGMDPITGRPYTPNPTALGNVPDTYPYEGYVGFDPRAGSAGDPYTGQNIFNGHDYGPAPNGGAGFYKNLSGHELPNAPHITATLTADYTVPLPNSWLATLHTDLYYQSEAWTRVFNTPGYDKLKAYTNVNLAAIFSNEDAGWKIMAYVKNVFDRDSITGAFLNSDDTGLTTNVFLTEPRLFGLRVTKEWTGDGWWTGANGNHPAGEPYPLTIALGGQVQHQSAPYSALAPDGFHVFAPSDNPVAAQNRDLDWGDGREISLTYRPHGSPWSLSSTFRYGKANGSTRTRAGHDTGPKACMFPDGINQAACDPNYVIPGFPAGYFYNEKALSAPYLWTDGTAVNREEHTIVDFIVGRDFGLGGVQHGSILKAGIRYADFQSTTKATMAGVPDEEVPSGWIFKYRTQHLYEPSLNADRRFKGAGPVASWEAGIPLLGSRERGHLDLDWSITGGVLFGRQKTSTQGDVTSQAQTYKPIYYLPTIFGDKVQLNSMPSARSASASVPLVDLSLGFSYEVQRIKVSTGYRWERYFNVLDTGYTERGQTDRTFDGPYFKVAVGFGG